MHTLKLIFIHIGENGENWCSTRSQITPSRLNTNQTLDNSFGVLQPVSAAALFLIVTSCLATKLMQCSYSQYCVMKYSNS